MSTYSLNLEILLDLFRLLQEKKSVTAKDIQQYFTEHHKSIDIRTAQRYLAALSNSPNIKMVSENPNTIQFVPTHGLKDPSQILSTPQQHFLKSLLAYGEQVTTGDNIIADISRLLDKNRKIANRYALIAPKSIEFKKVQEHLDTIEDAIRDGVFLSFGYRRPDKTGPYTVTPYRILFVEGMWYLLAEHDGESKKFRIDLMTNIEPGAPSAAKAPDNIDDVIQCAHSIYHEYDPAKRTRVTAEVLPEITEHFQHRDILPNQVITEEHMDGSLTVEFDIHHLTELHILVLRWSPNIRIIEPKEYREYLLKIYREGISLHSGDS